MPFHAWPEITAFHNIRKFTHAYPELLNDNPVVNYKAKVKLHGTNAAVQCVNGEVLAQSRTNLITPESDNMGFARWVKSNEEKWSEVGKIVTTFDGKICYANFIFYGEWFGPGVQKGVACGEIAKKSFAVFAASVLDQNGNLVEGSFITNPIGLADYVKDIPDTYVLPWYEHSIEVDWSKSSEELTAKTEEINTWVEEIEKNDPWIEKTFGIKGTGEGLVFYPTSHPGFKNFSNLCFKAKGEKHKNIATAKPAQVSAEAAASIDAFVTLVLTPARLEQGTKAVGIDMKLTGKFVSWCLADIEKETKDELEASNLTFKEVQKALSDKARAWYLAQAKAL